MASLGFIGFLAYAIVVTRLTFFLMQMFVYKENLRATGFFETDLEILGEVNAASDLKMDLAVYITSANGTLLSYD